MTVHVVIREDQNEHGFIDTSVVGCFEVGMMPTCSWKRASRGRVMKGCACAVILGQNRIGRSRG